MKRLTDTEAYRLVKNSYENPHGPEKKELNEIHAVIFGKKQAPFETLKVARHNRTNIWKAQNKIFNEGYKKDLEFCPIGFENVEIRCRPDSVVESNIFIHGFYDEFLLLNRYKRLIVPGSVVIDVGANIGTHSVPMAKITGTEGQVWAFEPRADLLRQLFENAEHNLVKNIVPFEMLAYKEDTNVGYTHNSNQFNQAVGQISFSAAKMQARKLDTIAAKNPKKEISLIKIDVEGAEIDVLLGAQKILKAYQPSVIVEYNGPPWNLNDLKAAFPYSVKITRIRNTLLEREFSVADEKQMWGFNNILVEPK